MSVELPANRVVVDPYTVFSQMRNYFANEEFFPTYFLSFSLHQFDS
jgi:hypothetical protein